MDLDELTANPGDVNEREEKYKGKRITLQRGSKVSNQSFFPLAVDDYFMSIAILSQRLGSADEVCWLVIFTVIPLRVPSVIY